MKIAVAFVLLFSGVLGAYKDLHCPAIPGAEVYLSCDRDCVMQHGALGGNCRAPPDYNCYCTGQNLRKATKELSKQCLADNDKYRNICTLDCICNHASRGGYCDFTRGACVCTDVGENVANEGCPYDSVRTFSRYIYQNLGPVALGHYAKYFVNGELLGI